MQAILLAAALFAAPDEFSKHLLLEDSRFVVRLAPEAIDRATALSEPARKKLQATFGRDLLKELFKQIGLRDGAPVKAATVSFRAFPMFDPNMEDEKQWDLAMILALEGDFRKENLEAKFAEQLKTGEISEIKVMDLPVYFPHRNREAMFFSQMGDRTLLFAPNRQSIEEAVKGVADLRKPREAVAAMFAGEGLPPLLEAVCEFNDDERKKLGTMAPQAPFLAKAVSMQFRLRIEEKETILARGVFDDTLSAAQAEALLKTYLTLGRTAVAQAGDKEKGASALKLMDGLRISAKEKTLTIQADLDHAQINDVFSQIGVVTDVSGPEEGDGKALPKKPAEKMEKPAGETRKSSVRISVGGGTRGV